MSEDPLQFKLEQILTYGIDIETKSIKEEDEFKSRIISFYNNQTIYKAYDDNDFVTITDDYFQPLLQLSVLDSTLAVDVCEPDSFFNSFYELLRFIKEEVKRRGGSETIVEKKKVDDKDLEWL